ALAEMVRPDVLAHALFVAGGTGEVELAGARVIELLALVPPGLHLAFLEVDRDWCAERLVLDISGQRHLPLGIELVGLRTHLFGATVVYLELEVLRLVGCGVPFWEMRANILHRFRRVVVARGAGFPRGAFHRVPDFLT